MKVLLLMIDLQEIQGSIDSSKNLARIQERNNRLWDLVLKRVRKSEHLKKTIEDVSVSIVNGDEVDPPRKYPYMVYCNICGASLIAPSALLTAAHCLPDTVTCHIGRHNVSNETEVYESFNVIRQVGHPLYDSSTLDYDYALLEIDGISNFEPVKIEEDYLSAGTNLLAMGWGSIYSNGPTSPVLLETALNATSNEDCNNFYDGQITDRMLCASGLNNGLQSDTCQGDSGGPLINYETGKQVGIVSWGYGCADPDYPGVYARISEGLEWIQSNLDAWGIKFCSNDTECVHQDECLNGTGTCTAGICTFEPLPCSVCSPDNPCDRTKNCSNPLPCSDCNMSLLQVNIDANVHWEETSFKVEEYPSGEELWHVGDIFSENIYREICSPNGVYRFTMQDSFGDGMCTTEACGNYTVSVNGEPVINGNGYFIYEDSDKFGICNVDDDCNDLNGCTQDQCVHSNYCIFDELLCDECGKELTVSIITDGYPEETMYEVIDILTNITFIQGGPYSLSYFFYGDSICLPFGSYEFFIYDAFGDGMCDSDTCGEYTVSLNDVIVTEGDGMFDDQESFKFEVDSTNTNEFDDWTLSYLESILIDGILTLTYDIGKNKVADQVKVRLFDVVDGNCIENNNDHEEFNISKDIEITDSTYDRVDVVLAYDMTKIKNSTFYTETSNSTTGRLEFCTRVDVFWQDMSVSFAETVVGLSFNFTAGLGLFSASADLQKLAPNQIDKETKAQLVSYICGENNEMVINPTFVQNSAVRICVVTESGFDIKKFKDVQLFQGEDLKHTIVDVEGSPSNPLTKVTLGKLGIINFRLASDLFDDPLPLQVTGNAELGVSSRRALLEEGERVLEKKDEAGFVLDINLKQDGLRSD